MEALGVTGIRFAFWVRGDTEETLTNRHFAAEQKPFKKSFWSDLRGFIEEELIGPKLFRLESHASSKALRVYFSSMELI